jgi:hypothetical protein
MSFIFLFFCKIRKRREEQVLSVGGGGLKPLEGGRRRWGKGVEVNMVQILWTHEHKWNKDTS